MDYIWDAIKRLFIAIVNLVKKIFRDVINFGRDVVGWFKKLALDPRRHVPFITNTKTLKEMIHDAPVVDCGIFAAVYDEQSDSITNGVLIEADELDSETLSQLRKGDDGITILR